MIGCNDAGSSWDLRVQDQASPSPHVVIGDFALSVPTDGLPIIIHFEQPIPMIDGIDVVTSGTPGEVSVWAHVHQGG